MAIRGYTEFKNIVKNEQYCNQRPILLNEEVIEWMHVFSEIGNECVLIPSVNQGELILGLENFLAFSLDDRISSHINTVRDTANVKEVNFLDYESDLNYSKILLFPPLGLHRECGYVTKSLEMLKRNGRMIVLIPDFFLAGDIYRPLRKRIMNEYSLEAVIPIGRISGFTSGNYSMLVVDNKPQVSKVYMPLVLNSPKEAYKEYISKSGEYWTDAQSIVDRIDPKYYAPRYDKIKELIKSKDTTSLGEAAEIYIRPQVEVYREQLDYGDLLIIESGDINEGVVEVALHNMHFCNRNSLREWDKNAVLQTGDILISTRGHISWGIYKGESEKAIVVAGVAVIRPRNQYKNLLDVFFNSKTGLKYLESQMSLYCVEAGVSKSLHPSDIAKIAVPDISVMKRMEIFESGRQLGDRVALLFKTLGWEVKQECLCGTYRSDIALFYNNELKGIVEIKRYKASHITRENAALKDLEKVKTQIGEAAVYLFIDDELYLYECGKAIKLFAIPRPGTVRDLLQFQMEQIGDNSSVVVKCADSETSVSDSLLVELLTHTREIKAAINRVETRVEDISEKIDRLAEQIGDYQKLVRKQIELAESEEEKDRIIHAFSEECTERIVRSMSGQSANEAYVTEKRKLQMTLGEGAWSKLDDASKSFLLTSKLLFNKLVCMDDKVDYSGVCLLVTKALEVELVKRFGSNFITFLKNKYPGKINHPIFPTALLDKYGHPLSAKHFTIGTIAYVLCYKVSDEITEEQKSNNKERLLEYSKEKIFNNRSESEMYELLQEYADDIEIVRKKYRNPSAHTNELSRIEAEECFALVLDVEQLLKRMLDSFIA